MPASDYLDFEKRMVTKLAWWGVGSIFAGLVMRGSRDATVQGVGDQFFAWGAIDWLLAMAGLRGNNLSRQKIAVKALPESEIQQKSQSMERLLALNTGLDVLYILGGWLLGGDERPRRQGWSIGILVQALFLLFFDALHWIQLSGQRR